MAKQFKYGVSKRCEVAGAHQLQLPYESKCKSPHGHNWIITTEIGGNVLLRHGMLIDFSIISNVVMGLDHQFLNDILDFNPTAESLAEDIADRVQGAIDDSWGAGHAMRPRVTKVTVQESEGNIAWHSPIIE
jgi:6-pyruvoyltetrahydropterin/6-carboxytetrahydropterin synthase